MRKATMERKVNSSKYMDKRIAELPNSQRQSFFDDDDAEADDTQSFDFHPFRPLHSRKSLDATHLRGWSSMDGNDSQKFPGPRVVPSNDAALVSEIDRKLKEHADILLHSVECLSARVSQMESRTRKLENTLDDLKESIEFHHGRTGGQLREMENVLLEVQGGIQDLKDKQEISETHLQLQLAKLQISKDGAQLEQKKSNVQASSGNDAIPSVSQQQPERPLPPQVAFQDQPHAFYSNVPTTTPQNYPPTVPAAAATASQFPTLAPAPASLPPSQLPQNIIHSVPQQEVYHTGPVLTPETVYQHQQFNVPPIQQSQLSRPNYQPYQPPPHLPVNTQLPRPPQVPSPMANPQFYPSSSHHTEKIPFMGQSSSQPPGMFSPQQLNVGSTQRFHDQFLNRYYTESTSASLPAQPVQPPGQFSTDEFYHHTAPLTRNESSNIKTFRPLQSPSFHDDQSSYSQLPTARKLPHAIPTASTVDDESSSPGSGNSVQVDDVIDKVVAMGFRRDVVRTMVNKLTENGQSVDLNVVLDKLMNNG